MRSFHGVKMTNQRRVLTGGTMLPKRQNKKSLFTSAWHLIKMIKNGSERSSIFQARAIKAHHSLTSSGFLSNLLNSKAPYQLVSTQNLNFTITLVIPLKNIYPWHAWCATNNEDVYQCIESLIRSLVSREIYRKNENYGMSDNHRKERLPAYCLKSSQ